jgi:predicted site-specific integrase-resolvase
MFKDEYWGFTDMLTKADVARTTLYRMIKDGKIKYKDIGVIRMYSYKDVINNKPRKK